MKKSLGGAAYGGLSAARMINLMQSSGAFETSAGPTLLRVKGCLPPDYLELEVEIAGKSFDLQCFWLPVYSARGPACEIAYRIHGTLSSTWQSDAHAVIAYFDRKLRQAGAYRVRPYALTNIVGDTYEGRSIPATIRSIGDIICKHQELRDAAGGIAAAWYASLTWASPRCGMIAAVYLSKEVERIYALARLLDRRTTATSECALRGVSSS